MREFPNLFMEPKVTVQMVKEFALFLHGDFAYMPHRKEKVTDFRVTMSGLGVPSVVNSYEVEHRFASLVDGTMWSDDLVWPPGETMEEPSFILFTHFGCKGLTFDELMQAHIACEELNIPFDKTDEIRIAMRLMEE